MEPRLGDFLPALLAKTKRPFHNPLQSGHNLRQGLLLVFQQILGELPLIGVGAKVCWVERHMRKVGAGLFIGVERILLQGRYISAEPMPQGHEFLPVACEFRFGHENSPKRR